MAANRLKPREYAIFVRIIVCKKNNDLDNHENQKEKVEVPGWLDIHLYKISWSPRHRFSRSKTGGRTPPPQDAST